MKILLWATILALNSMVGVTEEVKPTESTKGCVMKFCDISGGGSTEYFVKVADDENDSDDGEPQIWGYDPLNIHKDKQGHVIFQRELEKNFIRAGGAGMRGGCTFHCPLY